MSVSFNVIPGTLRTPLFYAEIDRSAANQGGGNILRTLLIGQRRSTGTVLANVPTRISSAPQAGVFFGVASMLHEMAKAYFANDSLGEVWAIAIDDDAGGTKGTKTIVVNTVASAAGVVPLYIAGRLVQVALTAGMTKAATAAAIVTACGLIADLPVVATTDGVDTVTLTARHKGIIAAAIDVRTAYLGVAGGESLPTGLVLAIAVGVAGLVDPDTQGALDAMGDDEYEFIAWPYTSTTALDLLRAELDDTSTGRWGPLRQLYGHAICHVTDTVSNLGTKGLLRNDPHVTIFGFDKALESPWSIASAQTGQVAGSIRVDPARPLQTLPLVGIHAPLPVDRQILTERNTLLHDGIATCSVRRDGTVQIERAISTYQLNAFGSADASMLDSETAFTLAAITRQLRSAITSKFGRHKIVNDGTRIGAGQAAVTPAILRAELIAQYRAMEAAGLVENADAFKAGLIVERNGLDPSRVDVLFPPDLANGLRIFALLNQFRLQYPAPVA